MVASTVVCPKIASKRIHSPFTDDVFPYVETMTFIETTAAVLAANFLTVAFFYVVWRANRDDGWKTIVMGLTICAIIGAIALAARP